jgi:hypothetical protein
MDFIKPLFSALSADASLEALLDTFAGEPAIFTGDMIPPPDDFPITAAPFIWIRPPQGVTNIDDFSSNARSVDLDICFYAMARETSEDIDAAVEAARAAIHRQYLEGASGEEAVFCTVSGPLNAPTSEASIAGRRLAARLHVKG